MVEFEIKRMQNNLTFKIRKINPTELKFQRIQKRLYTMWKKFIDISNRTDS